jgi:hypothetical protein
MKLASIFLVSESGGRRNVRWKVPYPRMLNKLQWYCFLLGQSLWQMTSPMARDDFRPRSRLLSLAAVRLQLGRWKPAAAFANPPIL